MSLPIEKRDGAVRHQALALRGADGGAQIGLARQAGRALAAFGRIERDDVVALLDRGDARADVDDDAGALMAEDRRKQAFRIGARQRELVGVADAGRLDLDQHLAVARTVEVDLHDLQRLSGGDGDCGAGFHQTSSSKTDRYRSRSWLAYQTVRQHEMPTFRRSELHNAPYKLRPWRPILATFLTC